MNEKTKLENFIENLPQPQQNIAIFLASTLIVITDTFIRIFTLFCIFYFSCLSLLKPNSNTYVILFFAMLLISYYLLVYYSYKISKKCNLFYKVINLVTFAVGFLTPILFPIFGILQIYQFTKPLFAIFISIPALVLLNASCSETPTRGKALLE